MRDFNLKEQLKKLMTKVSLERMPVALDMILMFMLLVVLELTSVEKSLLLSNL